METEGSSTPPLSVTVPRDESAKNLNPFLGPEALRESQSDLMTVDGEAVSTGVVVAGETNPFRRLTLDAQKNEVESNGV